MRILASLNSSSASVVGGPASPKKRNSAGSVRLHRENAVPGDVAAITAEAVYERLATSFIADITSLVAVWWIMCPLPGTR
jgi:hypothetical protein